MTLKSQPHSVAFLNKYSFAPIIDFKKSDCCQRASHTYIHRTSWYQAALCSISSSQPEHHTQSTIAFSKQLHCLTPLHTSFSKA